MLKKTFKKIKKKYDINKYNKKNHVKIRSLNANLSSEYGKNVIIAEETWISKNVEIGDFTYINKGSSVFSKCTIGKYCSISSNVTIGAKEHNYNMVTTHPILYDKKYSKKNICFESTAEKIEIGNDVWIGIGVVVLRGVKVGNGAVLGAGSVITKDVPPYSIVGGVPAKIIKYRFDENKIKEIEASNWWDWDEEKIISNIENFRNGKVY